MSRQAKSIVASGHPLVSEAAIEMLKRGGNAFDAAIAAGFISCMAEPALTSLGGGGFLLAKTAQGQETLFDFFVDTPGSGLEKEQLEPHFFPVTVKFSGTDQDFNIGLASVAVPGNLKGFLHVHKKLGSLPLEAILAPAVRAADEGVAITDQQAHFLELLYPIMTLTDEGKKLFEPQGNYLKSGDIYCNSDLAHFLRQLSKDNRHEFYHGEYAGKAVQDMTKGHGLLTLKDLAAYHVIEREPLAAVYRGHRLLTNPPPSFGGSLIAAALKLMERLDLPAMQCGGAAHLAALVEVMKEVETHRATNHLSSQQFLREWAARTSHKIKTFSRGTTHISVVDGMGNAASMTTSNGEGSGYILPGTGIMLNNMMGEDDLHPDGFHACPPGMRVSSMMSPSIMLHDDQVKLVLGSGGSKRIRTAITQVISNIIDFNMDVQKAVEAPRIHWDGNTIQVEPGFDKKTINALSHLGPVNLWRDKNVYFGGVHAVVPDDVGGGDPRRGGNSMQCTCQNSCRWP